MTNTINEPPKAPYEQRFNIQGMFLADLETAIVDAMQCIAKLPRPRTPESQFVFDALCHVQHRIVHVFEGGGPFCNHPHGENDELDGYEVESEAA